MSWVGFVLEAMNDFQDERVEGLAPEDEDLQQHIIAAIHNKQPIPFEFEVDQGGGKKRTLDVNLKWPTLRDESNISYLTAQYLGGVAPEATMLIDQYTARGRAALEVLAVGPFPQWLTPYIQKIKDEQGRDTLKPQLEEFPSREVMRAFYREWLELYNKFQGDCF